MWGLGTLQPKQRQDPTTTTSKPKPRSDIDQAGFSIPQLDHVEFTDADLDDPSLLAELAALSLDVNNGNSHVAVNTNRTISQPTKTSPSVQTGTGVAKSHVQTVDPVSKEELLARVLDGVDIPPEEHDEVHVELTEEDMNDPHLLAELSKFSGPGDKDAIHDNDNDDGDTTDHDNHHHHHGDTYEPAAAATAIPSTSVPIAGATATKTDIDDDTQISIEHKLKTTDTALLSKYIYLEKTKAVNLKRAGDKTAAFEALRVAKQFESRLQELSQSGNDIGATGSTKPQVGSTLPRVSTQSRSQVAASTTDTAPTISLPVLQQRSSDIKQAALKSKRAGNTAGARDALMAMKRVQDAIDVVGGGGSLPPGFVLPDVPTSSSSTNAAATTTNAAASVATTTTRAQTQPPQPNLSSSSSSSSTPTTSQKQSNTESKDIYDIVLTSLQSQIDLCTTLSAQYFKNGQKDLALEFHKRKKAMVSDMETVTALKSTHVSTSTSSLVSSSTTPLSFRYDSLTYTIAQTHQDVGMDEMEVSVVRALDLTSRDVASSSDLETCVVFDLGWPQEGDASGGGSTSASSGTSSEGKGETAIIRKSANPEYNYTRRIRIDRSSRPFQRYIERRKATFDIVMVKSGLLSMVMMNRRVVLGRVTLKMETLLSKCEVHEVLDVMDVANPRRATGGKLEVKIRLRAPVSKPDIVTRTERWLVVQFGGNGGRGADGVGAPVSTSLQASGSSTTASIVVSTATASSVDSGGGDSTKKSLSATPVSILSTKPVSPKVSPSSAASEPGLTPPSISHTTTTIAPKPAAATSATSAKTATSATSETDIETLEFDFLNPDQIASNQVLESEHAQIVAQITQLTATRKPVPEDLTDRRAAYEIRMNMLVTMVQVGTLTMGMYMAQVRVAVGEMRTAAVEFKRAGKMDLARQAMARVKLMTAEIAEVEAAGAE